MISKDELDRIERIHDEATHKIPKRVYPDDALFLILIIQRLISSIAEVKPTDH